MTTPNPGHSQHAENARRWREFRRKYLKPGMGKAAYLKAVRDHWKPTKAKSSRPAAKSGRTRDKRGRFQKRK